MIIRQKWNGKVIHFGKAFVIIQTIGLLCPVDTWYECIHDPFSAYLKPLSTLFKMCFYVYD